MYTRRRLLAAGTVGIAAISGCMDLVTGDGPLSETAQQAAVEQAVLDETGYELAETETETVGEEVEVAGESRRIEAVNQLAIYERAIDLTDELSADELEDELDGEAADELEDELDADDLDEDDLDEDDLDADDIEDFDEEDLEDVDLDEFTSLSAAAGGPTPVVGSTAIPQGVGSTVAPQIEGGEDAAGSVFVLLSTPAFSIAGQSFNPVGSMDNDELAELLSSEIDELTVDGEADETTRSILGSDTTVTTFDATAAAAGETVDMFVEIGAVESGDDFVIGLAAYPQLLETTEADNAEQLFGGIDHPVD